MIRPLSLILTISAFVLLAACGREKPLAPDMAFNFRCTGAAYPASEAAIEKFLLAHGFTVFNEEKVRRQYHLWLYPMAIDGFNDRHWMADFRGINEHPSQPVKEETTIYAFGLYSPPPTHHDVALEKAAIDFARNTLKCDVSQISHATNGADRSAFFNDVYETEQKRISEGRRCDKEQGKPLDSHCPS